MVCCAVPLTGVNTSDAAETVPSFVFDDEIGIVTLAVGRVASETVKVAVPPFSVVIRPVLGETLMPWVGIPNTGVGFGWNPMEARVSVPSPSHGLKRAPPITAVPVPPVLVALVG